MISKRKLADIKGISDAKADKMIEAAFKIKCVTRCRPAPAARALLTTSLRVSRLSRARSPSLPPPRRPVLFRTAKDLQSERDSTIYKARAAPGARP